MSDLDIVASYLDTVKSKQDISAETLCTGSDRIFSVLSGTCTWLSDRRPNLEQIGTTGCTTTRLSARSIRRNRPCVPPVGDSRKVLLRHLTLPIIGRTWPAKPAMDHPVDGRVGLSRTAADSNQC